MKTKHSFLYVVSAIMLLSNIIFLSCSNDDKIEQAPVSDTSLKEAKSILRDSIELNARAMEGTVDKTLLKDGCPLKYFFSWKGDSLNIQIRHFSVGNMPLTITFSINCKIMQLNSWEKDEYKGDGWIKFEGENGITSYIGNTSDYSDGTGGAGTVTGYLNVNTDEVEFETQFNVMNFSADVYQQKIDKSRIVNYDRDFTKYEADLIAYKKDHGLL